MNNPVSPLAMLATSMQAQPGVYALLLGSGVSTGAGVPTGWGVVTELVRRVAASTSTSPSRFLVLRPSRSSFHTTYISCK